MWLVRWLLCCCFYYSCGGYQKKDNSFLFPFPFLKLVASKNGIKTTSGFSEEISNLDMIEPLGWRETKEQELKGFASIHVNSFQKPDLHRGPVT